MYRSAYFTALALGATSAKEGMWFQDERTGHVEFAQQTKEDRLVNELFEKVVELPADERLAYLDKHCSDNLELKFKITELLKGADTPPPEDFLNPAHLIYLIEEIL